MILSRFLDVTGYLLLTNSTIPVKRILSSYISQKRRRLATTSCFSMTKKSQEILSKYSSGLTKLFPSSKIAPATNMF